MLMGGIGSRMHLNLPKQYYLVKDKPIFMYSFEKFANHPKITTIVLVIAKEWENFVKEWISKIEMDKEVVFAYAGKSRQHSILNGLNSIAHKAQPGDIAIIHDSVRPLFPVSLIDDCIDQSDGYDGALPVVPVKDAIIQSSDGVTLSNYLPKDELYGGQTPEAYDFEKYLYAHNNYSDQEISLMRGSADIAFRANMKIKLILSTDINQKITTIEDLDSFEYELAK